MREFRSLLLITIFFYGLSTQAQFHAQRNIFLDRLDISKIYQGKDRPREVGERARLRINNESYKSGIHTRAESRLYISLDGKANFFNALSGIDDRSMSNATAEFFVIGDGAVLWQSGKIKKGDAPIPCRISISGVKMLILKVKGTKENEHVDWVNASFSYSGSIPKTTWSPVDIALPRNSIGAAGPQINGAAAVGIRPNTPFLYPIAVTGRRPIKIKVTGLPQGLVYDEKNQLIKGSLNKEGDYTIGLHAENNAGKASRLLRVKAGDALALTPPMGFLSWNVIEGLVNETVVKETADAFLKFGLKDVGYNYIIMDDCWVGGRDNEGSLFPDSLKFPGGLKSLSDYLHHKGLFFGLYSSPGETTCAGYPGSLGYEEQDVKSWTSWGVDYLKYDLCSAPKDKAKELYILMGQLLKKSGRSMVYGLGAGDVGASWGKEAHAHLWRTAGDIRDQWYLGGENGIIECFDRQSEFTQYQQPGGWNDPDMILAGIYGKGASSNDLGAKGCSDIEYQSQMSLWSLLSAPLLISADVRNISPSALKIISNAEVIAVDQDPLGNLPVCKRKDEITEIWTKKMADGSVVVAFLNRSNKEDKIEVQWKEIGLGKSQKVRDLWLRKNMGTFLNGYSTKVAGHGVVLIRINK